jgi:hypothetical protein
MCIVFNFANFIYLIFKTHERGLFNNEVSEYFRCSFTFAVHCQTWGTRHDRRQQANPPLVLVGLDPSFKLGRCEGDCDDDSDCNSSDLVCFPRYKAYEAVPGCSGGLNDPSLYDYCVRKSDLNDAPTQNAGDLPLKYTTDFPLALCEGMSNGVKKVNDQKDK